MPLGAWAQCAPGLPCTLEEENYTPGDGTNAAKSDSETCDADFMNQLYARALMEADRETALAKTYMAKPDSVLEYTCFDQFVSTAAHKIGPLFTESTKWQSKNVNISTSGTTNTTLNVFMGDDRLDKSLENLVLKTLKKYTDKNFSHSFMGGNAVIDSAISRSVTGDSYNCSAMQQIWAVASCDPISTNIPTFGDIAAGDPRQKPASCPGTLGTEDVINLAGNKDFTSVAFDKVETFLNLLNAPGTAPAETCGPAIPTGLMAEIRTYDVDFGGETAVESNFIPDSICINPGCHYDLESLSCKR